MSKYFLALIFGIFLAMSILAPILKYVGYQVYCGSNFGICWLSSLFWLQFWNILAILIAFNQWVGDIWQSINGWHWKSGSSALQDTFFYTFHRTDVWHKLILKRGNYYKNLSKCWESNSQLVKNYLLFCPNHWVIIITNAHQKSYYFASFVPHMLKILENLIWICLTSFSKILVVSRLIKFILHSSVT
jgi:hypothetical protein